MGAVLVAAVSIGLLIYVLLQARQAMQFLGELECAESLYAEYCKSYTEAVDFAASHFILSGKAVEEALFRMQRVLHPQHELIERFRKIELPALLSRSRRIELKNLLARMQDTRGPLAPARQLDDCFAAIKRYYAQHCHEPMSAGAAGGRR